MSENTFSGLPMCSSTGRALAWLAVGVEDHLQPNVVEFVAKAVSDESKSASVAGEAKTVADE